MRKGGRPKALDEKERRRLVRRYLNSTLSGEEIAERHGISVPTLRRYVREYRNRQLAERK